LLRLKNGAHEKTPISVGLTTAGPGLSGGVLKKSRGTHLTSTVGERG
jgi:hypothetical protein